MFYLVQDNSSNERAAPVFFSSFADILNRDRFNHFQTTTEAPGELKVEIEDLWGGGDADFNDVILSVTSSKIVVPGQSGEIVPTTVVYEGKSADINSEIGLLVLDEGDARIDNLLPGDMGYEIAALKSDRALTLFTPNSAIKTQKTLNLEAGKYLGMYVIVGGTLQQWLEQNPDNQSDRLPYALFSDVPVNPDGINHFNRFGSGKFGIEDLLTGGDRDFNDALIRLSFGSK
jgi:hypothetical protein